MYHAAGLMLSCIIQGREVGGKATNALDLGSLPRATSA